jgi:hypothetical protein
MAVCEEGICPAKMSEADFSAIISRIELDASDDASSPDNRINDEDLL